MEGGSPATSLTWTTVTGGPDSTGSGGGAAHAVLTGDACSACLTWLC